MPSGISVFEARLKRIESGQKIIGEGLQTAGTSSTNRRVRRGGWGRVMLFGLLVACSVTGAVAAGHGPEGLDDQIFALTSQVQVGVVGLLQTVADRGSELVPSG